MREGELNGAALILVLVGRGGGARGIEEGSWGEGVAVEMKARVDSGR